MKLIKLLSFIIVSLVIANVTYSNTTIEDGLTVAALSSEIRTLSNQNLILKSEIAALGSLDRIKPLIAESGYEQPSVVISLTSVTPVAMR